MIDLFAGIGVASLAADIVWGKGNVEHEFVEWNPYGQTILKKHFPNAKIHGDIKSYKYSGEPVDLVWGSPPCQAASSAGKRKGKSDDRWLWPETFGVIAEAKPRWWCLENVQGLLSLEGGWHSPRCSLKWKILATKSKYFVSQLSRSALPTSGTGSGLSDTVLPTPSATPRGAHTGEKSGSVSEDGGSRVSSNGTKWGATLQTKIAMLPTPATRDYKGANGPEHMVQGKMSHMGQLPNAVAYPEMLTAGTPTDSQTGTHLGSELHKKPARLRLHPHFVMWMMGLPRNYLDLPSVLCSKTARKYPNPETASKP